MPQPQFDAKLTSADGKTVLFIRGPFDLEERGYEWWLRMVPVSEMGDWMQIWKREEVEDDENSE